jgi:hypothetical protein
MAIGSERAKKLKSWNQAGMAKDRYLLITVARITQTYKKVIKLDLFSYSDTAKATLPSGRSLGISFNFAENAAVTGCINGRPLLYPPTDKALPGGYIGNQLNTCGPERGTLHRLC